MIGLILTSIDLKSGLILQALLVLDLDTSPLQWKGHRTSNPNSLELSLEDSMDMGPRRPPSEQTMKMKMTQRVKGKCSQDQESTIKISSFLLESLLMRNTRTLAHSKRDLNRTKRR
jgi:hypothetical protein